MAGGLGLDQDLVLFDLDDPVAEPRVLVDARRTGSIWSSVSMGDLVLGRRASRIGARGRARGPGVGSRQSEDTAGRSNSGWTPQRPRGRERASSGVAGLTLARPFVKARPRQHRSASAGAAAPVATSPESPCWPGGGRGGEPGAARRDERRLRAVQRRAPAGARGFDVELARAYARERGLASRWVPFRWPRSTATSRPGASTW